MALPLDTDLFPAGSLTPASAKTSFRAMLAALRMGFGEMTSKTTIQQALGVGGRNKIHNGNFVINQRGLGSTASLAAGQFGHDRWKAGSAGCNYTVSTDGIDTILTISYGGLIQVIEGINIEAGTYCVSWEGTSQLYLGGSSFVSSPYVLQNVPANAGGFAFQFSVGTLSKVQIERADAPTPFERRSVPVELAMCQRYYENGSLVAGGAYPTGGVGAAVQAQIFFKVTKRATPTMAQLAGSTSANVSSNPFSTPDTAGCGVTVVQDSAVGNFSLYQRWAASADI